MRDVTSVSDGINRSHLCRNGHLAHEYATLIALLLRCVATRQSMLPLAIDRLVVSG